MNYQETLDFLFHSLPAYHRIGAAAYKADLTNTERMMDCLGHPEEQLRVIHVAGTNGKGSVSHWLASILHRAGYRTGLYTSPHLVDFRERIRINGEKITEESVVHYVEKYKDFFVAQGLSFFEMTVGMAFDYFRNEKVDIAVVEVGMGGRLDSTNVVHPLLSVITNISLDHTQFLGQTTVEIAAEKAGIIKQGIPVVVGETQPGVLEVFERTAAMRNAPLTVADQHWTVEERDGNGVEMVADIYHDGKLFMESVCSPMDGYYQRKNLATVCAAYDELCRQGFSLSEEDFRLGIENVIADTGLHGRWEKLGDKPLLICETAHNADGIAQLVKKLETMTYGNLHLVYGCVSDKDYSHILDMLPQATQYYYTKPSVERGLDEKVVAQAAAACGKAGKAYSTALEALSEARANADDNDLIIVTGSIFLVADLLKLTNEIESKTL